MSRDEPAFVNNEISPLSQTYEKNKEDEAPPEMFENDVNSSDESDLNELEEKGNGTSSDESNPEELAEPGNVTRSDESERKDSEEPHNVTGQDSNQCTQMESEATRSLEIEVRVASLEKELELTKVNYEKEKRERENKEQRIDMHARESAKFKKENETYQKEIRKLQDERNRYQKENKRLEEDNSRYQKVKKNLEKLEEENSRYQSEKKNLEEENSRYQGEKEKLVEENSSLKKQIEVAKGVIQRLKDDLEHTKQEANKRKLVLEQALDKKCGEYTGLEAASKLSEKQFEVARKNNEARTEELRKQFESAKKKFEARIEELQNLKGKAEREALEKQHVIERKDRDLWQQNQQIQQMQSQIQSHIRTIDSLDKDKKDLTLRLSKLAGANLTYNNPNIADLSDENRPTKLAEEFSELYDNEWTDAFEVIEMENEQEKTQFMLKILKRVSNLCHDTSQDHMNEIKRSFVSLNIRDEEAEKEKIVHEDESLLTATKVVEANVEDNGPQNKPADKCDISKQASVGTDLCANNNGISEITVDLSVEGHQLEAITQNEVTTGSLSTEDQVSDHSNANTSNLDGDSNPDVESKDHIQDKTKKDVHDKDKGNEGNVHDKELQSKSIYTSESSNQTFVREDHSAKADGNTENIENQTADVYQSETVTDIADNQMTEQPVLSQSNSSMNPIAQNEKSGPDTEKDFGNVNIDTEQDSVIKMPTSNQDLALEHQSADGEMHLNKKQINPDVIYKNNFGEDDMPNDDMAENGGHLDTAAEIDSSPSKSSDPENPKTDADAHLGGENPDPNGGHFDTAAKIDSSPSESSDPENPKIDAHLGGENPDPVDNKTLQLHNKHEQTNAASKSCSRTVQTAVYTNLKADFENLANEQKKTILEIRKVFEHQLSEQFFKIGTDMVVKEFEIKEQNAVVNYVRKCMRVCWSMCRHEPPVHIKFPETKGDLQYDTNMFKPYTKTGKHLDFVVWPALYLHENGPMLAKGVAQGRK